MHTMCFVSVAHAMVLQVSAIPRDDTSLLVQWRSLIPSSPSDFVVEWRPLLNTNLSLTQFEITDRNQTSLLIKGMLHVPLSILIFCCVFILCFFPIIFHNEP